MRLNRQLEDQAEVRLSIEELVILRNALNEFCNGLQFTENDFQTILDVPRAEAEAVLLRLNTLLDRLDAGPFSQE